MKKQSSPFAAFVLKAAIVTAFILNTFTTSAQSIVGKWKMTAAKETVTDKASGKSQDLSAQMGDITKMMEQIIEFHPNNTYYTSNKLIGSKSGVEGSGTYSVSGKVIKLQQGKSNVPVSATKYPSNPTMSNKLPDTMTIVSQSGNLLVLHYSAETTDKGRTMVVDIENTFTKQ